MTGNEQPALLRAGLNCWIGTIGAIMVLRLASRGWTTGLAARIGDRATLAALVVLVLVCLSDVPLVLGQVAGLDAAWLLLMLALIFRVSKSIAAPAPSLLHPADFAFAGFLIDGALSVLILSAAALAAGIGPSAVLAACIATFALGAPLGYFAGSCRNHALRRAVPALGTAALGLSAMLGLAFAPLPTGAASAGSTMTIAPTIVWATTLILLSARGGPSRRGG